MWVTGVGTTAAAEEEARGYIVNSVCSPLNAPSSKYTESGKSQL